MLQYFKDNITFVKTAVTTGVGRFLLFSMPIMSVHHFYFTDTFLSKTSAILFAVLLSFPYNFLEHKYYLFSQLKKIIERIKK